MEGSTCYVEDVIVLLGKKWMLTILRYLFGNDKMRFNELLNSIGQITPRSLSQRLKELVNFGIVQREQFNEIPPRVEYSLTESGKDLTKCFRLLEDWSKKFGKSTFPKSINVQKINVI